MSILERFRMDGRVAIVTGAGMGIGRAIAIAFADAGADVVCASRTLSDVEETAAVVRDYGRKALAISCDVTDEQQLQNLVAQTVKAMGRITHLVNTVGMGPPNKIETLTAEAFSKTLTFNVTTAYALTRLCVPVMRAGGPGNVINISSAAARYIQRNFSAYGSAKAALQQLTRLLAQDLAPEIRVNAIAPGPILTRALATAVTPEILATMGQKTPLQCLGTPEDIAAAAVYLASPASGWVSGKIIEVDGGAETTVFPDFG